MGEPEGAGAKRRRVTLADVSRLAGVSVPTVSHVLSGNKTVSLPRSTRERVLAAAKELGYRPNRNAQAMRSGRTNVVAVWMPLDRPIVTYLRFLDLLWKRAKATGYDLMVAGLDRESALGTGVGAGASSPLGWPVDGIVALDAGKAVEAFRASAPLDPTPVAVLGYEVVANGDAVAWDVQGAEREAVARLLASGARRVAHVTPEWILADFPRERRRLGYTEAMEGAGLPPEFVGCRGETSALVAEDVAAHIARAGLPDAFTGFTDTFAIGAAKAALASGARIPEDVRVVGFGDFPESADFAVPLSTIRPPLEEIVARAWEDLTARIERPDGPSRFVELPMRFVARDSTGDV